MAPISFGYDTRPLFGFPHMDIPASNCATSVLQLEYPLLESGRVFTSFDEYGEQSLCAHWRFGHKRLWIQRPMSGDGFAPCPINSLSAQTLWMRIETSSIAARPRELIWDAKFFL